MDSIFCTLFDSNYLDKGIVLYNSMIEKIKMFKLYVFAFDERTFNILKTENFEKMVVVPLSDFESSELISVKNSRTLAEYCWTCTPWIIKYVLEKFGEEICTYIDSDMMFFSDPQSAFDQMKELGCSVLIVPHRFKTKKEEVRARNTRGEYCVEFNTFVNDKNGKKALDWWAARCLEWCFYSKPGTTEWYGDQKYLNVFPEKFDGVFVCNNFGVGLAPWNIDQVDFVKSDETGVFFSKKNTGLVGKVVIYHFESVFFFSKRLMCTPTRKTSRKMHTNIYKVYCEKILWTRKILREKYNFEFSYKRRIVTKNPIMKLYQQFVLPLRHIKRLTDLYWVKEK